MADEITDPVAEQPGAAGSVAGPGEAGGTEPAGGAPAVEEPGGGTGGVPATPSPAAPAPVRPDRRKVRDGLVVSNVMDKTAVVAVVERVRHPRYAKTVQRTKRFFAHDETNETRVGDRVRIAETRPLSKRKRWRVVQVLERAR